MSNEIQREASEGAQPLVYQIRIQGHLGREWTDWFGGLTIIQDRQRRDAVNRPGGRSGRVAWLAPKSA